MKKWFRKNKNKENNQEEVVETSEELVELDALEPAKDLFDSDDEDEFEETQLLDEAPVPEEEGKKKKRRWFRWGSVKETEEPEPESSDFDWEESPEAEPADDKEDVVFSKQEAEELIEEVDLPVAEPADLKIDEASLEAGFEAREVPPEPDFSDESAVAELQSESMQPGLEEELDFIFSEEDLAELTPEERRLKKEGFFARLKKGLAKTRSSFAGGVDRLIAGRKVIDEDLLEELEELLITADVGVKTTVELIRRIQKKVDRKELSDPASLKDYLEQEIQGLLDIEFIPMHWGHKPVVIMVIGVNGTGKTTTIGKLAARFTKMGKKVLLVAGDTFRAAATEQLEIWSQRVGCQIIKQGHGADPSAVAFDGIQAGLSRDADVVIIDTAGRLHTKVNLMEELKKMQRVIGRQLEGAPHEVLLVLDATTGQNALSQAKMFNEAIGVSGLVLTKLDGTAKGGIVLAITQELNIPVRFIGVGEAIADLREFMPREFAEAMFEG